MNRNELNKLIKEEISLVFEGKHRKVKHILQDLLDGKITIEQTETEIFEFYKRQLLRGFSRGGTIYDRDF